MLTQFGSLGAIAMPASIGELLIWVVVIAACIALTYVALKKLNVQIPDWIIQVFWIVVVALVVIFAIRLVLSA